MSGRLDDDLMDRFVEFTVRVLHVVGQLDADHRPKRIVDQLTGSGTSPGAQIHEASEALSRADFVKSLGWAAKELSETRYWLTVIAQMEWIPASRLDPLIQESRELLKILKAMIVRTRANTKKKAKT